MAKSTFAVPPCEEAFAGLPPALSRDLVSRTSSTGVCNSRAILLNDPLRLPIGTGEVKVIAPILAKAQRENQ